ncbi:putative lectin [Pseudoneurospora amorphoporcata]|uniref:Lectin n=1 Tax=Pseudoneurospora amorphoporcata TaxID=241081 RepID=A0AAN6NZ80_9PEZI|nr:putative lectin [Pseudoneurospora amorphoporcata]
MLYTLHLRLINDTSDPLTLVEQTSWWGKNTIWSQTPSTGVYVLSMANSGSSGMLRFQTSKGDFFAIAAGVHNYKRWCDVLVDTGDEEPLTKLHPKYYDDKDPKYQALWAQASEVEAESKSGKTVRVKFYQPEGNVLRATIEYV